MVYSISNSHKHPKAKTLKDFEPKVKEAFEPKVKEAPKSSFTTAEAFAVVGLIGGSK